MPTLLRFSCVVTAFAVSALSGQNVFAQTEVQTEKAEQIPLISRLDGFTLSPEIQFIYFYDDNIYARHDDELSDNIYGLSGRLDLESNWTRHSLTAGFGFDSARYARYSSEDYDDYWLSTEGQLDLTANTRLLLGAGYSREHEGRNSPDLLFSADQPTVFSQTDTHALLSHSAGDFAWRLGATYAFLDFDDNESREGVTLNNDDRDRTLLGLGGRLTYRGNGAIQPFIQFALDKREYESRLDDYGYDRSSKGYRLGLGATARLLPSLAVEAFAGTLQQDYNDGRFGRVNDVALDARLDWQLSERSRLNLSLSRTLEETSAAEAAGYIETGLAGQLSHRISRKGTLRAGMYWGREDYLEIDREDDLLAATLGYQHEFSPRVYLDTLYTHTQRDSSITRLGDAFGGGANTANVQSYADFDDQIIRLTLGIRFNPVADASESIDFESLWYGNGSDSAPGGFYLGALAARDVLGADVWGARGEQGWDRGEYADMGFGGAVFAGYGTFFGPWYLGLESDYESSGLEVNHGKDKPDAQTLSFAGEHNTGLDLHLGRLLPGGNLIYARLGRVRSSFETYNTLNDYPAGAYNDTDAVWGMRYGVGADVPLNDHVFLRLDYGVTGYDDYDLHFLDELGAVQTAEYSPERSVFRVGLGWRPNPHDIESVNTERQQGFYAALLLGNGALQSSATGVHQEQGGSYPFGGGFGATGEASLTPVIGYAWVSSPWQLALEFEADATGNEWRHERYPGGRNFNVEQKARYGAGVRLGYRLDNGTLLYLLAGADRARFNTEWVKGSSPDTVVERDDEVWGRRFGVGTEIPLGQQTALRIDYTETDYDSYKFITTQGQPDQMTFDNQHTQFRIGLSHFFW